MEAQAYHQNLSDIFRDKPELVTHFPEWMLSPEFLDAVSRMERPAIVEIAGRDSVAAAVKSASEHNFTDLIPVYAYTGTEYGEWEAVIRAVDRLAARLTEVKVHRLLVMGSPGFWRALNARFIEEWHPRFHYYSPCPGCHLYLHVVRFPLAKILGGIPIISGERELHSGIIKINQTGPALDVYLEMARRFNVRLLFPLRHIAQGKDIETILRMPWERDKEQLKCTFSGNYRRIDGSAGPSVDAVNGFFMEFALPAACAVMENYMNGGIPDCESITRQVLAGIPKHRHEKAHPKPE